MGRVIGAVLAGALTWVLLWVGGTMGVSAAFPALLPAGQRVDGVGVLTALIAYSVVLSALAGMITGRVAREDARTAGWWLAGLQLVLGIGFEASSWSLTPVWYHLIFLALLVPATVYGGTHYRSSATNRPASMTPSRTV